MMKSSLLLSFFFFTIILQASWCLASESSNGEKLATLPRPQAEAGTIKDVGLQLLRCTGFSSFWGMRKARCTQTNSNYSRETFAAEVPNAKYSRKLRITLQTMSLSHKGGAGGGGGGGGGSGVGGGKGGGGSGSQSNHQAHKKENNAISLACPWIYILLEIGIYAIAALPFTLI